jgi:hypothetical protein
MQSAFGVEHGEVSKAFGLKKTTPGMSTAKEAAEKVRRGKVTPQRPETRGTAFKRPVGR